MSHFVAVSLRESHFFKAPFQQQSFSALVFPIQYFGHFLKNVLTNPENIFGGGQDKTVQAIRPWKIISGMW